MLENKTNKILIYSNVILALILLSGGIFVYIKYSQKYSVSDEQVDRNATQLEEDITYDDTGYTTKEFSHTETVFGQTTEENTYKEVHNTIKIPQGWSYEEFPVEDGTDLQDVHNIEIEDPEYKVRILIEPLVNADRGPLQVSNQKIIATREFSLLSLRSTVNIVRCEEDKYDYSYLVSYTNPGSDTVFLDVFGVLSEDGDYWPASVFVYLSEDNIVDEEIGEYLHMVDTIVLSLKYE